MGLSADIIVAGAGMAGATAAYVLGEQGWKIILVDPREQCAPAFKVEKIAHEQVPFAKKFGILDHLQPIAGVIREVQDAYNGRIIEIRSLEQYGLPYADMVNALRAHLPSNVTFKRGSIKRIHNGRDHQRVKLADGEPIDARLIVLASGIGQALQSDVGLKKRVLQKDQCFILGFMLEPIGADSFSFDALTYFPTTADRAIDYLTLFRYRRGMRANLFVFRPGTDSWIRRLIKDPERELASALPGLYRAIGPYRIAGKVEAGAADLTRMEGDPPAGVAVIGDAFHMACPATGLGLNKIFSDVQVLSDCVPRWMATPGMGVEKMRSYYEDPVKRAMDDRAIQQSMSQRQLVIGTHPRWRIRRMLRQLERRWKRPSPYNVRDKVLVQA